MPDDIIEGEPVDNSGSPNAIMERFNEMKKSGALAVPEERPVIIDKDNLPPAPGSEPAPEPEKVAEPVPEPQADKPAETPPPDKGALKISELKKEAQEYHRLTKEVIPEKEKQIAALEEKLKTAKTAEDFAAIEAKIAEKERQNEEYEARVARLEVRESREYKRDVKEPLDRISRELDNVCARYEDADPNALRAAIETADPVERRRKIAAITQNFDTLDVVEVREATIVFDRAQQRSVELHENAVAAKRELEFMAQEEEKKKVAERTNSYQTAKTAAQKEFESKLPFLKDDPQLAAKIFAAEPAHDDPMKQTFHAMAYAAVPELVKASQAKDARIKELEAELAARASLAPKAGGRQTNGSAADPMALIPQGNDPMERYRDGQAKGLWK